MGSFFVFSAFKVAIGMLLLVLGWKLFRLVIAFWAAVTVGTIAAGVALAGSLQSSNAWLTSSETFSRGISVAAVAGFVAFIVMGILTWRYQRGIATANAALSVFLAAGVVWLQHQSESQILVMGAVAGLVAGGIVYLLYDVIAVVMTAGLAAALLAPGSGRPQVDLGLAQSNNGQALADWFLRTMVHEIESLARNGLVTAWVVAWALAIRFLLWSRRSDATAAQGDAGFVLPPSWERAFYGTAALILADIMLSGFFGLGTTLGTIPLAYPVLVILVRTAHQRLREQRSLYLVHVIGWSITAPLVSAMILAATAHTEAAVHLVDHFCTGFRSHSSYTSLAPATEIGLGSQVTGMLGRALGMLVVLPATLALCRPAPTPSGAPTSDGRS